MNAPQPQPMSRTLLPALQADLAADQIELGVLRIVQRRGVCPIAAASGQAPVEGRLENIDGQIIMNVGGLLGALHGLAIANARLQEEQGAA